jgi:hypothetical protein
VKRYKNAEESLIIIDAPRAYFESSIDIISFANSLSKHTKETGKSGLSVFADMGSFFYYDKVNQLIRYETSLSSSTNPASELRHFVCTIDQIMMHLL